MSDRGKNRQRERVRERCRPKQSGVISSDVKQAQRNDTSSMMRGSVIVIILRNS